MATLHVACLCAAWCRLCDAYRAVQQQVARDFAEGGADMRWHWIDIEDDAELLGEVDVETFPTLIVVAPDAVRFAGPLLPHADTLRRVLRACLDDVASGAQGPVLDGATRDFALRLLARPVDPTG